MPSNKDAYYFPHDSNAKDDPKCIMLIEQLGLEGYGIFWVLIETLRDQPTYRYPLKLIPALARRFNTTTEKISVVIHNYGLFQIEDDELFFSKSLDDRMKFVADKKEKAKLAAAARWEKQTQKLCERNADAMQTHSERNAIKEKKIKENKRKENKIREKEIKQHHPQNVFSFFQQNIGPITPFQAESISKYMEEGMEEELITEAIKDSLGSNNPWRYLDAILRNAISKGVLTLETYNAKKVEKARVTKPQQSSNPFLDALREMEGDDE